MFSIIALASTTGIGTPGVSHDFLGPAQVQPQPSSGSGVNADAVWRVRWKQIADEIYAKRLREAAERSDLPGIPVGDLPGGAHPLVPVGEAEVVSGEYGDVGDVESEADYTILPVGENAAVRAMAAGWIRYVYRDRVGLCAALAGDDGVRYLYVGLGRPVGQSRQVSQDDVIGFTRSREQNAAQQVVAGLLASGLRAEQALQPERRQWVLTIPVQQTDWRAWPSRAEVGLLGGAATTIAFAAGLPLVGAALGISTAVLAATRLR